jgi:hypothetical protein
MMNTSIQYCDCFPEAKNHHPALCNPNADWILHFYPEAKELSLCYVIPMEISFDIKLK